MVVMTVGCCVRRDWTYSSQKEIICFSVSKDPVLALSHRTITHIICEPVVLERLHILSSHYLAHQRLLGGLRVPIVALHLDGRVGIKVNSRRTS